ncbi:MAG: DUF1772 domain-containing protein [Ktedonobacteraceae bacterium]|nr:DUF1772 domain-containing protein [Ktedonobacteraceae bacterium]
MKFEDTVLVVGGTLTGLSAGLFYTFNGAIIPALRHLKGAQHIIAMQSINEKIENPVFFLSFFGPTLLLPLAAFLHRGESQFGLLVSAAILHITGINVVTAVKHIPLNNDLKQLDANQLSEGEADRIREDFQRPGSPWMRWHTVRTLAGTAATALVFLACISKSVPR